MKFDPILHKTLMPKICNPMEAYVVYEDRGLNRAVEQVLGIIVVEYTDRSGVLLAPAALSAVLCQPRPFVRLDVRFCDRRMGLSCMSQLWSCL